MLIWGKFKARLITDENDFKSTTPILCGKVPIIILYLLHC